MAGENEWRVPTSFRELVLRLGSSSPGLASAPHTAAGLVSQLMFALQRPDAGSERARQAVHSALATSMGRQQVPAHQKPPPYWQDLELTERELRRALQWGRLTLTAIERPRVVAAPPEVEVRLPPPKRASPVAEPANYDVKVIDDTGAPVAGIDINLTVDDAPETIKTSGGGTAHSEGHSGSPALLKMLDVSGLPAKLEAQWQKPRAQKLPSGADTKEVPAGQKFEPLSVRANVPFTLILGRPPVRRVRMLGMLFDANKCFLLPQALPGILSIVDLHRARPTAKVLLVGHAGGDEDLAGADIAVDRADIVAAYLTSKPEPWLAWFKKDKPARSRWGTREVQLMLSALPGGGTPFYQGWASGITDEKTRAATKAFQKSKGLKADGKAGSATLKALVAAYLALEDTNLARDIVPVTHGCEGHFPDEQTANGLEPDDRRLDAFFFDSEIKPDPPGKVSPVGSPAYAAWRKALVETRDFEHHGIHVQIIDARKHAVPFAQAALSGPVQGSAVADEYGFVSFFGLLAGEYTITATLGGHLIGNYKIKYPTAKTLPSHQGASAAGNAPANPLSSAASALGAGGLI